MNPTPGPGSLSGGRAAVLDRTPHRFVPAPRSVVPPLLLLHGTGGDENDLIPLGRRLSPDAALLSPRGAVLEGGMPRFFHRLAPGVFDQQDLERRTEDLARFVEEARSRYGLFSPPVAVGLSNGANIAASLLLRHPRSLAGAILFRAMPPFEPGSLEPLAAPVLIAAAIHDPLVTRDESLRLRAMLVQAGSEVSMSWADGGHTLTEGDLARARAWIAEHGFSIREAEP